MFGQYAKQAFQWLSVKLNFTSVLDQKCQAGNYTYWSPNDEVRAQLLKLINSNKGGNFLKKPVVLRRWGVLQDNLVLSAGLICELATVERLEN